MIVGEFCGHETDLEDTVDRSHLIEETNPDGAAIVELADWLEMTGQQRAKVRTPKLMIEAAIAKQDAEDAALHPERLAAWEKMNANTFAMKPTVPAYTDLDALGRVDREHAQLLPLTTAETFKAIVRVIGDERDQDDYYVVGDKPLVAVTAPEPVQEKVLPVFDQVRAVLGPDLGQASVSALVEPPEYAYLSAYRAA